MSATNKIDIAIAKMTSDQDSIMISNNMFIEFLKELIELKKISLGKAKKVFKNKVSLLYKGVYVRRALK